MERLVVLIMGKIGMVHCMVDALLTETNDRLVDGKALGATYYILLSVKRPRTPSLNYLLLNKERVKIIIEEVYKHNDARKKKRQRDIPDGNETDTPHTYWTGRKVVMKLIRGVVMYLILKIVYDLMSKMKRHLALMMVHHLDLLIVQNLVW